MRTVDRNSEPCPAVLGTANTAAAIALYSNAANTAAVNNALYAHKSVVNALRRLYLTKCSLCEIDAQTNGVVEHFIPHHPQRANLAYDWNNLHWTCGQCNQRKKRDAYKDYLPGTKVVNQTILIDPANSGAVPAEGKLSFDPIALQARPTAAFSADSLTLNTVVFLNDSIPHMGRLTTMSKMLQLVSTWGSVPEWKAILVTNPINLGTRPNPLKARESLTEADRLYLLYLDDTAPFCTSMRSVIAGLGVSPDDVARLGREHRRLANIPLIY